MSEELVSVIMSVYNEQTSWIIEAVESILHQTYKYLEIIIVIDNPNLKASSKEYLEKIEHADYRVKILYNKANVGLAASLNNAINIAKGSYIARMDADDISEVNRIEKQLVFMERFKIDVVGTGRVLIDETGKNLAPYRSPIIDDALIRCILPLGSCFVHPSVMMKANILKKANGYRNFRQSQDYDLWLRLLDNGCTFANIDEPLLKYRVRKDGITNTRPYLQYITARYQKSLHNMRIKTGRDNYSSKTFEEYLRKKDAFDIKKNKNYSIGLSLLEESIGKVKKKKLSGLGGILRTIAVYPEMFTVFVEKMKIVYYMKRGKA